MRVHGLGRKPIYQVWRTIKARCYNPNNKSYEGYGGRGIVMCRRWLDDAGAFNHDVGEKPTSAHSIDRIDNDGNYSCGQCEECIANGWPMNVRWATPREQIMNRRPRHLWKDSGMQRNNTSGYRGVIRHPDKSGRWIARVRVGSKYIHVDIFSTAEEAAYVRDQFALQIYGPTYKTNLLSEEPNS